MSLLIVFLSLFIGLSLRYNIIPFVIISIIFLFFVFRKKNKWLFSLSLFLILLGVAISFIHISFTKDEYQGVVIETKENYFILSSWGQRLYVYQYNHPYEVGDILKIKGIKQSLSFNHIESGFDFTSFLEKKGIYDEISNHTISFLFKNPLRLNAFKNSLLQNFDDETSSFMGSLLFSFSKDNDSYLIQKASSLHLFRYMSASGVYVYFFIGILNRTIFRNMKDKSRDLFTIIILTFLLIISSSKFSIIRIYSLGTLNYLKHYILKQKWSYLSLLSLSGLIFLLIDYHLAYQDSFILGYLIPLVSYFTRPILIRFKSYQKRLIQLLIIYLLFIPFALSYNHDIAILSPLYQIILFPVFVFFIALGILCLFKIPLYSFTNGCVSLFGKVLNVLDKVNPKIHAPEMNPYYVIVFYILLALIFYYSYIRFHQVVKVVVVFSFTLLGLYFLPLYNLVSEKVSFINVGQGDCCLIRSRANTIMIDTGGNRYNDIAYNNLIPYLKKERIYDIDLLITTHDDFDHNGAMASLKENFKVKRYVNNHSYFPIKIGNIKLTNYNSYYKDTDDDNYKSLVIGFHVAHKDFLIMGDAPIKIEKEIMNHYEKIDCDILKVGHHGSNTSTCAEWVKYLCPEEAIISCGRNNSYGHPHGEVIKILKDNNVIIKRTDLMGTITYQNYIFM